MYKISYCRTVLRNFCHISPLIILFGAFLPSLAYAVDMRGGRRVSIPAGHRVSGNLYAAASEIFLSGNVQGDFVAVGGEILIDGIIAHDVTVAGGQVRVTGEIGGDLRVAGGQVELTGKVAGDVVVAGGSVRILSGGSVGGDVVAAGRSVLLEGTLARSVRVAGDQVMVNAIVSGPVGVRATRVEIGERAVLENTLAYFSPEQAVVSPQARIAGTVTFYMTSGMDQQWLGHALRQIGLAFFLLGFLMTLTAALLATVLLRAPSANLVRYALDNFGRELLRGFVLFFVIPPAIFLLTLTVVGVPLAFLASLLHFSVGIVSVIFTGILIGALLLKLVLHKDDYAGSWQAVVVGVPIAFLVSIVPIFGFFFNTLFFLAVFGSLYGRFWSAVHSTRVAVGAR